MIKSPYLVLNGIAALYLAVTAYILMKRHIRSPLKRVLWGFLMVCAFLAGARLLYGILYIERIVADPMRLFTLQWVNFALYGGLILAGVTWWWLIRRERLSFFDVTAPLLPHVGIALFLSKMGCFFNGCCYGKATRMPWGMVFERADRTVLSSIFGASPVLNAITGTKTFLRHPTQLYEAAFGLLAGGIVFWLLKKRVNSGIAVVVFVVVYTVGRLVSFFFRDFPAASAASNFVRGPVVYGLVLLGCVVMTYVIYRANQGIDP